MRVNRVLLIVFLLWVQAQYVSAESGYKVYQNSKLLKTFQYRMDAINYAKKWDHSAVEWNGRWIWNNYPYQVYQNDRLLKETNSFQEAAAFARKWDHSSVRKFPGDIWLWDNYPYMVYHNQSFLKSFSHPKDAIQYAKWQKEAIVKQNKRPFHLFVQGNQFAVYQRDNYLQSFPNMADALAFAKRWAYSRVVSIRDQKILWKSDEPLRGYILRDVPVIRQNPELPRGCEVTSMAMLLHYAGKPLTKIELARQVIKDPTPARRKGGRIVSWGDPNIGFVGNMYDLSKPGYGVYHEPLHVLLNYHSKGKSVDLKGAEFSDILAFLEKQNPVLVIINSRFRPVHDWVSWEGPKGIVRATYREHAVLLVGYDGKYVYVNDPLTGQKNRKLNRHSFQKGWEQMGRQAITIVNG